MLEFFFLRQRQMAEAKSTATSSSKCSAFLSRYLQHISLAASFSKFFTLEYELSFAIWISSAIISFCSKERDTLVKAKLTQTFISIWITENVSLAIYLLLLLLNGWFTRPKSFKNLHSCNWQKCLFSEERKGQRFSLHVSNVKFTKADPALLGLCPFIGMKNNQHCI